ncbi:MAG: acetylxylan esterase [Puniceicoccales bacterium]
MIQKAFLILTFAVAANVSLQAMESNLARPYGDKPSPPHDSRLVFWSAENDELLFDAGVEEIVLHCRAGLRAVSLDWALSRNRFDASFLEGRAEALPGNRFIIRIPTSALVPGVYDLKVSLDSGVEKPTRGICTFGFAVEEMTYADPRPADFEEFWQRGLDALSEIPLEPELEEMTVFSGEEIDEYNLAEAALPGDYDPDGHRFETVESAKVSFAGIGEKRIYGWLAKPEGEGPFPAMLVLPGAGFAARPRPLEHARHGFLALDIQIHGQDVDQEEYPRLPGYYEEEIYDPIEDYYYYDVYLNVVQAINYLASRPDVDMSKLVVVGGSQGGRLSIVAAALDGRIKAAVPAIPHSGHVAYLKWFQGANDLEVEFSGDRSGMDLQAVPPLPDTPEGRCLAYYDPLSFAPDVTCPVLMNAGMVDPISFFAGVYPVFQELGSSDKTLVVLPGLGHDWTPEFDRMAWRWLDGVLGLE